MKYYLIAGEASGDLHASHLMEELKKQDPAARFRCWGGDLMKGQGGELVRHYRDLAFMGFFEVLVHLRTISANLRFCKKDLLSWRPDVLILVDYPGFNLRIASFAKQHGFRVFYYISPQIWAWHSSRVRVIRKNVERMFVILPFEKEFYARHDYPVDFVGHPLLDVIPEQPGPPLREADPDDPAAGDKPLIALLPGSRKQEIRLMLEVMLKVLPRFPGYRFVVAGAPSVPAEYYAALIQSLPVKVVFNKTYELLRCAQAALVTSGTATLETALMKVPQVVCYKGNPLSYLLARQLVHVDFISLVNLVMGREIVRELIQGDLTPVKLTQALGEILTDEAGKARLQQDYRELRIKLGGPGASAKTASLMINYLTPKPLNP
ncbi:MAG TPA: lipid-A-disaccharide synthase [Bacteroidales bacterium]|nr:lipid-A-disaccharide synthase [Bacteroidales bacterium]